jgi:Protein of unknown function (DUF3237)
MPFVSCPGVTMPPTATIAVGMHIGTIACRLTKIVEYGVSFADFAADKVGPPPQGARFDITVEGSFAGSQLKGAFTAVDYVHVRADGRVELHPHGEITTDDDAKIAYFVEGVVYSVEGSPVPHHLGIGTLSTASAKYAWVNGLEILTQGPMDLAKGEMRLEVYSV